jgi:hypothetical protein
MLFFKTAPGHLGRQLLTLIMARKQDPPDLPMQVLSRNSLTVDSAEIVTDSVGMVCDTFKIRDADGKQVGGVL